MSAITIVSAPSFPRVRPLLDTRPARGQHRAPRTLRLWRTARAEFALGAATLGGLLAATVLS
jgi:hypothetical protein